MHLASYIAFKNARKVFIERRANWSQRQTICQFFLKANRIRVDEARLAKNVGSAFDTIFGHGHDSKCREGEQNKDVKGNNARGDSKDDDSDDDVEEKKTA